MRTSHHDEGACGLCADEEGRRSPNAFDQTEDLTDQEARYVLNYLAALIVDRSDDWPGLVNGYDLEKAVVSARLNVKRAS